MFVCIWSLFPNAFCLAVARGLEKSRGVSQAAMERTLRGGLGGPTATAPTEPYGGAETGGFLCDACLTCTQMYELLTHVASMCGQNKISLSGRAPGDCSVHVQVAHCAELLGPKGNSDESPEAM